MRSLLAAVRFPFVAFALMGLVGLILATAVVEDVWEFRRFLRRGPVRGGRRRIRSKWKFRTWRGLLRA